MLRATIYLALVGAKGLRQLTEVSALRAHRLAQALSALQDIQYRAPGAFLYEFALTLPVPAAAVIRQMAQHHGILCGIDVGKYLPGESNTLLVAVTELNSDSAVDQYIAAFKETLTALNHGSAPSVNRPVAIAPADGTPEALRSEHAKPFGTPVLSCETGR